MRKMVLAVALLTLSTAACKKTGEGEYEVQRPTVGTTTDTVRTPSVEVGRETTQVVTPDVDVKKDTTQVVTPTVKVKKP